MHTLARGVKGGADGPVRAVRVLASVLVYSHLVGAPERRILLRGLLQDQHPWPQSGIRRGALAVTDYSGLVSRAVVAVYRSISGRDR